MPRSQLTLLVLVFELMTQANRENAQRPEDQRYFQPLDVTPKPLCADESVNMDYDIVYVRAPRRGDEGRNDWAAVLHPAKMDPGADLMLLHPDGTEELQFKAGETRSIADPFVSFDGRWVYYAMRSQVCFDEVSCCGRSVCALSLCATSPHGVRSSNTIS